MLLFNPIIKSFNGNRIIENNVESILALIFSRHKNLI